MFTDYYPGKPGQERRIKLGNGEKQSQNQKKEQKEGVKHDSVESDGENLPSKIEPRISDCRLNPEHGKRIEGA